MRYIEIRYCAWADLIFRMTAVVHLGQPSANIRKNALTLFILCVFSADI